MLTNIRLYPWFKFCSSLLFWQAIWFLYFQETLSAAEAIMLAATYDIATTLLEVPLGYLSDRVGRRLTLILASISASAGCLLLVTGDSFTAFALAQVLLGAGSAFASGTDSALLYESLDRAGRGSEIQDHELRAWRFSFTALAISALTGGALASKAPEWAYLATFITTAVAAALAWRFTEPARVEPAPNAPTAGKAALGKRVLAWLFCLSVGMYVLSHVPFVFGQPFIREALDTAGLADDAPLVSGAVSAVMMAVSVATSWGAAWLYRRLGSGALFLTALGMQVGLIGMLALTSHPAAIALLVLRMVPDSLSRPFILARIHPLLGDKRRATYLSIQSLCGRLILAATLIAFSTGASDASALAYDEIREILAWYLAGGLVLMAALTATLRYQRDAG